MKGIIVLYLLVTYIAAEDFSGRRRIKIRKGRRKRPISTEDDLKSERAYRVDRKPGFNSFIIQNENGVQVPFMPGKTSYYFNITGEQSEEQTTQRGNKEPSITILFSGESKNRPEDDILKSLVSQLKSLRDKKNPNQANEKVIIEDLTDVTKKPIRTQTFSNRKQLTYAPRLTTSRPRATKPTTKRRTTTALPIVEEDEYDEDGFKPGTYVYVNNKKILKDEIDSLPKDLSANDLLKKTGITNADEDSGEYYDYIYYYDDDETVTSTTKRFVTQRPQTTPRSMSNWPS